MKNEREIIQRATECLQLEAASIEALIPRLDESFVRAVEMIQACKGKIVVTGVGKSGHIGNKIAATLASTGTPAFFLNPLDAYHGDLGMLGADDLVLAISYSGATEELVRFLPLIQAKKIRIIGMSSSNGERPTSLSSWLIRLIIFLSSHCHETYSLHARSEKIILAILHRLQLFHCLDHDLAGIQFVDAVLEVFHVLGAVERARFAHLERKPVLVDHILDEHVYCRRRRKPHVVAKTVETFLVFLVDTCGNCCLSHGDLLQICIKITLFCRVLHVF